MISLVFLKRWLLVLEGFEPPTSRSADRSSPNIRDPRIRQRRRQGKRRWKIDFASISTFSPLYQVTQLLDRREVRLELKRGDLVRFQRDKITFITLPFPFSSQLKIWSCHVVVVQGRQRNKQKKHDARAELLFCPLNLLLFWRFRCQKPDGSWVRIG